VIYYTKYLISGFSDICGIVIYTSPPMHITIPGVDCIYLAHLYSDSVERRASSGEPRLESLVLESLVGLGDLKLGNSVPCGNPDSALDSTFSYTFSYCSAPGESERLLRNRG
jgi:hypothetical protein